MSELYVVILVLWIIINAFALIFGALAFIDGSYRIITPRYLYKSTRLNWVSVWIIFILYLTVAIGYALPYIIHWLTHVGRND
jgi:hypothetical protein